MADPPEMPTFFFSEPGTIPALVTPVFRIALILIASLLAGTTTAIAQERTCISGEEYEGMWDRFQAVEDVFTASYDDIRHRYLNNRHRLRVNRRILGDIESRLAAYRAERGAFEGSDAEEHDLLTQRDRYQAAINEGDGDYRTLMAESDRISRLRIGWYQALSHRRYSVPILYAMRRVATQMRHDLNDVRGLRPALTSALSYSFTHMVRAGSQYGCAVPSSPGITPEPSSNPAIEDDSIDSSGSSAVEIDIS